MLVHAQSFVVGELADLDGSWLIADPSAVSIVDGYTSPAALFIHGAGKVADLDIDTADDSETLIVQAQVRFDSFQNADTFLSIKAGGNVSLALRLTDSGGFDVVGATGAVLATATSGTLIPGVWHYLELSVQWSSHARVQLRVDGSSIADLYAVNTHGSFLFKKVAFGCERNGTTWAQVLALNGVGDEFAQLLGPSVQVADDNQVYALPPYAPGPGNAFSEILGYLDARSDTRAPAMRRHTWKFEGASLADDSRAQATVLSPHCAPLLLTLSVTQVAWSPARWSEADTIVVNSDPSDGDTVFITGADMWTSQRSKYLFNCSADGYSITLVHQSAGEPAENRFALPDNEDLIIPAGQGCFIVRDLISARWRATLPRGIETISGVPTDLIALL